jgi:hypothetical protein
MEDPHSRRSSEITTMKKPPIHRKSKCLNCFLFHFDNLNLINVNILYKEYGPAKIGAWDVSVGTPTALNTQLLTSNSSKRMKVCVELLIFSHVFFVGLLLYLKTIY